MQITTAPSLLFGLGTRIFLNKFIYHYENSTITDFVILGLWQGTAVYGLLQVQAEFAWAAAVGILGRLLFDLTKDSDANKCACTLLGVALGVLVTDILSQYIEDDAYDEDTVVAGGYGHTTVVRTRRLVQFSRNNSREPHRDRREKTKERKMEVTWEARSIITANSISSSSDLVDPKRKMTPLQREVANLRAKASLADTERRRFKEEKKWAKEQGNVARAAQMGWQVRRYAALMESFHREADAMLLESSGVKPRPAENPPPPQRTSKPSGRDDRDRRSERATVVNIDFGGGTAQRKRSSGTLKPAIRVQGREVREPGPSNPKR